MKKRDVASALMAATVAWNILGFATGFFGRAWGGAPVPVARISYALNVALALFSPLARSDMRWTALASTVLGASMAVWPAVGVFTMSEEKPELVLGVPGLAGPGWRRFLGR